MAAKNKISHILIPEHSKLSEKEKEELFKRYTITIRELPKIYKNDPAIVDLGVKENDVIKIIRKSPGIGSSIFYRGVINEQ
jgi:DNA-directed RNA polymerase subunit H